MKLYFRTSSETLIMSEPGGILGRAEEAAIRIVDASVSGRHAEFSWDGKQWWIHPLNERNRVLRDGVRLPDAKIPLGRNGTLQFGKVQISFWTEGDAPKVEAAPRPEWQRLRIKEVPAGLLPGNPPILDISPLQAQPDAELPLTLSARPPIVIPPPPSPPPPVVSGRGKMFLQAGILGGLLAMLCIMGFCVGVWLL